jgi:hypothetical protein
MVDNSIPMVYLEYMSNLNSEPINRLDPTKCPFCSPSTLACGWSGHQKAAPALAPEPIKWYWSDYLARYVTIPED